jgi:hypothetical protein
MRPTECPNYAGSSDADDAIEAELHSAGIPIERLPLWMRDPNREVKTTIVGSLHGWVFTRAWRYWVCTGPGIPCYEAMMLHEVFGEEVRVDGHCGCPSPLEQFKGLGVGHYHVDTIRGLKALADAIRQVVASATGDHQHD